MRQVFLDKSNKENNYLELSASESAIALDCIKKNISFNLKTPYGFLTYIATADGSGILTKLCDGKQFIREKDLWVEI